MVINLNVNFKTFALKKAVKKIKTELEIGIKCVNYTSKDKYLERL